MARFRGTHHSRQRASPGLWIRRRLLVEAESRDDLRGRLRPDARDQSAEVSEIFVIALLLLLSGAPLPSAAPRAGEDTGAPLRQKWVEKTFRSMTLDEKI